MGAKSLAQRTLVESVKLFAELNKGRHEETFIQVLLELGKHYVKQRQLGYGAGCYEWALLLSIAANLLECEFIQESHTEALSTQTKNQIPKIPINNQGCN